VAFVATAAHLMFPDEAPQAWQVGEHRLNVRWWRDRRDDVWKLAIRSGWPGSPARKALGLVEVWVASRTGSLASRKPGKDGKPDYTAEGGPALARLKLLLLVRIGIVHPASVRLARLPEDAPMSARLLWMDVIQPLMDVRMIDPEGGDAVPLARGWLAHVWVACVGAFMTEGQVEYGKAWLRDNGFIAFAGHARSRRGGRPTTLWKVKKAPPETLL
jgi:hypothetical protein